MTDHVLAFEPAVSSGGDSSLEEDLRIAVMRTARRLRAEKAHHEISDSQFSVLAMLSRYGPRTPGELAALERVQPPSMTRIVASLEAAGYVARSEHPHDGRQSLIALTDEGRAEVVETRRRRNAWLAARLAELSPSDREVIAAAGLILRSIADS